MVSGDRCELGLTPAGAGSTSRTSARSSRVGAYPRRCGEHHHSPNHFNCPRGLPPQVRGAREVRIMTVVCHGLTPAGAGSTSISHHSMWQVRAYPRRCGEHFFLISGSCVRTGLPPQVRGAPARILGIEPRRGLTPAGAGSTAKCPMDLAHKGAYPRRCGEHRTSHRVWPLFLGLPPQVRGARGSSGACRGS